LQAQITGVLEVYLPPPPASWHRTCLIDVWVNGMLRPAQRSKTPRKRK